MKILHLTNHAQEIGNGIVNAAVDLAYGQALAGHEVHYGSSGGQYETLLQSVGVTHHRLSVPGANLRAPLAFLEFQRLLAKVKPDIVHAHMVGWALLTRLFRPLHGFASVATVHYVHKKSSKIMGGSDAVVALGSASKEIILGWGTAPSRIHVVVNAPLGTPRRPPVESIEAFPMQSPAIVSVGGMYFHKGFGPLIDAFAEILPVHPTATLHLVGDGPDRAAFEAQAAKVAPDRIRFHGFKADPRPYMKSADVFVLASDKETFPLVLLEAREFGTRIVATDVDGNREALDEGQAGWMVAARSADALRDGILLALSSDVPAGVGAGLDRYRGPALVEATDAIYRAAKAARAGNKGPR